MNTLVAMGTLAAYGYSVLVTLLPDEAMAAGLGHETYFDSAAIIIGLILLGRWLEARAKGQAAGAVQVAHEAAAGHRARAAARRRAWTCRWPKWWSVTSCACDPATGSRSTAS